MLIGDSSGGIITRCQMYFSYFYYNDDPFDPNIIYIFRLATDLINLDGGINNCDLKLKTILLNFENFKYEIDKLIEMNINYFFSKRKYLQ